MSVRKTPFIWIFLLSLPFYYACHNNSQQSNAHQLEKSQIQSRPANGVELVRNNAEERVDIFIDGEHFTSYIYPKTIAKPVLYPIKTSKGTFVTRGFPLNNRPGERIDHPHHIGLWLNYGDVNGLDFWNNSDNVPEEKRDRYGTIVHRDINSVENGENRGKLSVATDWVDAEGNILLKEETDFIFSGSKNQRTIDRFTKLTADEKTVSFKDNKEGMLGMRMARALEQPTDNAVRLTDDNGSPMEKSVVNNDGVTGLYRGSNGLEGDDVWGTRAAWMNLSGEIDREKISVVILDHPDNVGYPTYWHARGYGLFAANPLGQEAMSNGKEALNFKLGPGQSVTFKYRIIIYSNEEVTDALINSDAKQFSEN